jgi:hypothetical protein
MRPLPYRRLDTSVRFHRWLSNTSSVKGLESQQQSELVSCVERITDLPCIDLYNAMHMVCFQNWK